ncbi:PAS domain S-box protein [Hugenholtzia roseola]|uniref:PAS domain S-box protein n=1 Tax=Hugenholtzia roseola TaxID=1002 RepID=UPI0004794E08|nr:PAS domain S-box protein [Hugenholtzia roseola]
MPIYPTSNSLFEDAFFKSLFDAVAAPIWVCNRQGLLLGYNDFVCELFGVASYFADTSSDPDVREKVAKNISDLIVPSELAKLQHFFELDAPSVYAFQMVFQDKILHWQVLPKDELFYAIGKVENFVSKPQENPVPVSLLATEVAHSIVQTVADGILTTDSQNRILTCNPALLHLFGYKASEIIGKSIGFLFQNEEFSLQNLHLTTGWSSLRTITETQLKGVRKNGTIFPLHVAVSQTEWGGAPVYVAVMRDLSHQKMAEWHLKQSQQLTQAVFEGVKIGLCVVDAQLKIRRVNQAFCQLFAYTRPQDLVGKPYWDFLPLPKEKAEPLSVLQKVEWVWKYISESPQGGAECRLFKRTGEVFSALLQFNPINSDWVEGSDWEETLKENTQKTELLFVVSVTDVSVQKKNQRELEQAKQEIENIFQSLDNVFWSIDLQTQRHIAISNAVERLYGVRAEQILSQEMLWFETVWQADQDLVSHHRNLFLSGKPCSYEYRIKTSGGDLRWVRTDVKILYDDKGKPVIANGIDTDITEQKRVELSLQRTENLMRSILYGIPETILLINTQKRVVWANPAAEKLFGYSLTALIGTSIESLLISPFEESRFENMIARYRNHTNTISNLAEDLQHYEMPYLTAEGQIIETENVLAPVKGTQEMVFGEGERLGYLIVIRNLTEKNQLLRSLAKFKQTLDATKDCVFIFENPDTKLQYFNKGAIDTLNYGEAEMSEKTILDLIPERWQLIFYQALERLRHESQPEVLFELPLQTRFKIDLQTECLLQYTQVSNQSLPATSASQRSNEGRFIAIFRDISERKATQVLLAESELKFRSTFEQASIGVMHLSLDLEWATFNERLAQMVGYQLSELSIEKFRNLLYPPDLVQYLPQLKRLTKGSIERFTLLVRLIPKRGDLLWVKLTMSLVRNIEEEPAFYVLFLVDISEQKQAEFELTQTLEALQRTNEELDHFVYKTSHDLRSPLTSILGLLNVIDAERDSKNIDQIYSYLDMVRSMVLKLDEFIHAILDYSKNGNQEVEYLEINLNKLVQETCEDLKFMKQAHLLHIETEIQQEVPYWGDKLRLEIILKNFISNAIKYQDFNKNTHYAKIKMRVTEKRLSLQVADNGIGILEAAQPHLFSMFFRANDQSQEQGSGLGLYIVKQAVEKLGGRISFKSKVGKGTTFFVELPNFLQEKKTIQAVSKNK